MDLNHRNLTQCLVHELGKKIINGSYSICDKLPPESELSTQFNVSRTSIREAVKMLTAKGLLISRPKHGITVTHPDNWNLFDVDILTWFLEAKPDLYLLRHFLQFRLAIEPKAAFLAAKYADKNDLENIQYQLKIIQNINVSAEERHKADIEFHKRILYASKNPFFIQLKEFISTAIRAYIRFTNYSIDITNQEIEEHNSLFELIKNNKPISAYKAVIAIQKRALFNVENKIKAS